MTQQFNTFCFTVFTGGIIQAFIGNHWNLDHLHHGICGTCLLKPSAGCAELFESLFESKVKIGLTWMKNWQNKTHFMSKYDLRNLQMHLYIRPIFGTGYCLSEKQRLSLLIYDPIWSEATRHKKEPVLRFSPLNSSTTLCNTNGRKGI